MSTGANDNLAEIAEQIRPLWDGRWHVAGRPITNLEMHALTRESKSRQSCDCEDGPRDDGQCRYGGRCPLVDQAKKLLRRQL